MAGRRSLAVRNTLLVLLLLLLIGGGYLAWKKFREGAGTQGRVVVTVGDATVERNGASLALRPESGIYSGDILLTQDHTMDLRFAGDAVLRMGPTTKVTIGTPGIGPMFRLQQGALRLETSLASSSISVGVPYGIVSTHAYALSVMDISVNSGVFVRVGSVTFDGQGKHLELQAGENITVDGLLLKTRSDDPATLEDLVFHTRRAIDMNAVGKPRGKPLPLTLVGESTTQVAHKSITASYQDKKRQPLTPGDTVVTDNGGAKVLVAGWGEIVLESKTSVAVVDAEQNEGSAEARLRVERGSAQFHLTTDVKESRTLALQAGAQELDVMPGYAQAFGHFSVNREGQLLTLRLGRVQLAKREVEAGSLIRTEGRITDTAVRVLPLAEDIVDVSAAGDTVVHHIGALPAVNFHLAQQSTHKPHLLELARDANFHDVRWAEKLKRGNVIVDSLKTGRRYFWRVDRGTPNALHLVPQTPPGCASCPGPNPVTDEFARTVIQFEEMMPDLAFDWQPIEGAKTYLFRLYRDNHFDAPVFVNNTADTNITVPGDRLLPGGYIWRVAGYDYEGMLVRTTQSYELNVQDLDSHLLTLAAPAPGTIVNTATTVSRGEVSGASSLTCNGHAIRLEDDGSFAQEVPLHAGVNLLVYTLRAKTGAHHIYTRIVHREAPAGHPAAPGAHVSED